MHLCGKGFFNNNHGDLNEMQEYRIKSVQDIFNFFRRYRRSTYWKFRGHSIAEWKLTPSAGREPFRRVSDAELFNSWKVRAVAYLESYNYSEWDMLAIAQHNGLPTGYWIGPATRS